jgi:hypothetical protein
MNSTMRRLSTAVLCAVLAGAASAQDGDELRAKELQAKIKKQMAEIDEILLSAEKSSPKAAAEKMEAVKRSLDELLKDAQTKQAEVVSDIEELVRMAKLKQSNQGGQGKSGATPPQSGQKPPPERGREPDVDELKQEGEKPQQPAPGEEPEPKDGEKPDSGQPDRQKETGDETTGSPPPDAKDKFEREDTTGRWGVLPGKVEELLKQLSTDQFPERYKKLIEQYYRRSQKAGTK